MLKPMGTFQPFFCLCNHIGCCEPPNFPETSSPLMSLTLLPSLFSYRSVCSLSIFWEASSSKFYVFKALFSRSLHGIAITSPTHSPWAISPTPTLPLSWLHLPLTLHSLEQFLRYLRCVISRGSPSISDFQRSPFSHTILLYTTNFFLVIITK